MLRIPLQVLIPAKGTITIFRNADAMGMVYYKRSDGTVSPAEFIHGIYRISPVTFSNFINDTDEKIESLKSDSKEFLFDIVKEKVIQRIGGGGGGNSNNSGNSNWKVISKKGIIAFAGGGQSSATPLTTQVYGESLNRIDTVLANDASVKPSTIGSVNMAMVILNRAGNGNAIMFFTFGADQILTPDDALVTQWEIADGNELAIYMYETGIWTVQ